jgi:Ca2+-binding EF-hand superfamily protein
LDTDCDGFITKDEVVETFRMVGIDASNEINAIMNNVDIDGSGELDFTEIKIALTDWEVEISEELLKNVLRAEGEDVQVSELRHIFEEILPHEWNDFSKKVKVQEGKALIKNLKEYLLNNLE